MRVVLPPRLSDFDFNTLVSDLVSTAIGRNFYLGDDVDVLRSVSVAESSGTAAENVYQRHHPEDGVLRV